MVNISMLSLKVVKEKSARYNISKKIKCPDNAYEVLAEIIDMENLAEEHLILITLDTKNVMNGIFTVSVGSLNSSIVHPREVFKRALLQNAASIMLAHNHPSGDTTPSREDINTTNRIKEAGKILGIELLDHLIVGEGCYVSLKERGFI